MQMIVMDNRFPFTQMKNYKHPEKKRTDRLHIKL